MIEGISRLYLDTNVFIYAFEEKSRRSDLLSQLFGIGTPNGPRLATSELSLSELLVLPYSTADDVAIDAYDGVVRASEWLDVGPIERSILLQAAVLRSQNKKIKLPDAIHVSTAISMKCSHFMTDDRGIGESFELVHTKYGRTTMSSRLTVVRPDEPTLSAILETLAA